MAESSVWLEFYDLGTIKLYLLHRAKKIAYKLIHVTNTVCPTRYRTRYFFNNFTTNEDIRRTTDTFLFISHTTNVPLFKFRCNIFIGLRIIKEMPGSVASGTPVFYYSFPTSKYQLYRVTKSNLFLPSDSDETHTNTVRRNADSHWHHVRCALKQGSTNFPNIQAPPQNSRWKKGDRSRSILILYKNRLTDGLSV
jgi:hypothetical protein